MSIQDLFNWTSENYGWVTLVMVALISGLVELLKIPFKKLTSKIKNEKVRKLANKFIILLAFGIAFGLRYAGSILLPKFIEFTPAISLIEGAFSNLVYALAEGIITPSKAKELATTIQETTADGTIDAGDVAKITSKLKKTDKSSTSAEAKFNDLIGKK